MVIMSTYASSSQGPNLAFNTASFHCVVSTFSLSSFSSCDFTNLCMMATVHTITFTLSYLYCSSHASVYSLYMLGSSCSLVTTSRIYSKSTMQYFTVVSIAPTSLIVALHYSLTFCGVEGWDLNSSFVILRFSSN